MLTNEFISLCKEFSEKCDGVLGEDIEDSKKLCRYRIVFFNYVLEFRYVKKETAYFKASSLYCVLGLKKGSVVYYHLTDIIPFLPQKSFKPCYYGHIESAERLGNCFERLVAIVDSVTSQISPLIYDDSLVRKSLFESYKMIYSLKDDAVDFGKIDDRNDYAHKYFLSLQKMRDGYIFSRFSNSPQYSLLLKNKKDAAIAKYEKLNQKDKLLDYEKYLLEHIKDAENYEPVMLDDCCDTSDLSSNFHSLGAFAKAFILVFAVASVFLCGFCAIYNLLSSKGAIVALSAPWYIGFLSAAFCSVFGSIAFFLYMPNKRLTKEERKKASNILISKSVKKISVAAFVISVVVSVVFSIMIVITNVRFYDDNIEFDSKSYSYSQVDSVYYIDARYNEYGDRIERASYVILFTDKTSLDLDGYTSVDYTQNNILPLLIEKTGVEIKRADSERQLPWYS